jgi:hypothetical protein
VKSSLILVVFCGLGWSQLIPSDAAETSWPEKQTFLQVICPGTECSPCPPETSLAGQSDFRLRTIIFGHFLGAGSEDALVGGSGCESHANGYSGVYLLTKNRSLWLKVWYNPHQNLDDCKKLTGSDGRDRLVCAASDMHFGVADSFLYLVDPGLDPDRQPDTWDLFFTVDDSLGGCVKMPDGTTVTGEIESISFAPEPQPPAVRITANARLGKAQISDKILSACEQGAKPSIATVSRRYEFLFDGKKILPDPKNPPIDPPTTSYQAVK